MKKYFITPHRIGIIVSFLIMIVLGSCNQNRNQATLGNSTDTNNVTKAGGNPIRDTTTINKQRTDSAKSATNSTGKGNVDPSGHYKK